MAKFILIVLSVVSLSAFGYGLGVSSHPLQLEERLITTEFGGTFNEGKGAGLQARFTQKINDKMTGDAGFGFSSGDRKYRLFANLDYEIFPDYMKQPKVTVRGTLSRAEEFDSGINRMGLTPTVSKGFVISNREVFPYLALPFSLDLNSDNSEYEFVSQIAFGATSNAPVAGYEHLLVNFEGTVNIDDGYSGLFLGISYPLN